MKIALVDAQKNRLLTVNYQGELATATAFSPGTSQIFVERSLGQVFNGLSLQIVYTPYIFGKIPAWGYDYEGTSRTVDNTIANLRRKLVAAGLESSDLISSHSGLGYRLTLPDSG